jgi:cytochrome c556
MKKLIAAAVMVALTPCAFAQFAKPEDAIKYRKAALTVMARHFGLINATIKGDRPFNAADVAFNAEIVATTSHLPWDAFVAGSDTGDTKAKPEIWKDQDKFKKAAVALTDATTKLSAAAKIAKSGDDLKAAFGATGIACKGCHDDFRAK